jgi:hypothetical protein
MRAAVLEFVSGLALTVGYLAHNHFLSLFTDVGTTFPGKMRIGKVFLTVWEKAM